MTPTQLRDFRKSRQWTQTELAEMLGLGLSTIGLYERGGLVVPRYIRLACAALALGLTDWPKPE